MSLVMVPLGTDLEDWGSAVHTIRELAGSLDVAAHRGLAVSVPYVRSGLEQSAKVAVEDVLIFKCPQDIEVWEAAPLCSPTDPAVSHDDLKAFFGELTRTALEHVPKVAWVAAHDWSPGDMVRWQTGSVAEFLRFVVSFDAWSTTFLGVTASELRLEKEWPYWFEVTR
jgi:hypothetical protein